MKERPKVGDRVEFWSGGVRIGTVVAVAETGVHFRIEVPFTSKMRRRPYDSEFKYLRISINAITRILPEVTPGSPKDDGECARDVKS